MKASIFNVFRLWNQFLVIITFLRLTDDSNYDWNDPNCERLYKVCSVIEYIVYRFKGGFKSVYVPN